jgi:hypothetical protein
MGSWPSPKHSISENSVEWPTPNSFVYASLRVQSWTNSRALCGADRFRAGLLNKRVHPVEERRSLSPVGIVNGARGRRHKNSADLHSGALAAVAAFILLLKRVPLKCVLELSQQMRSAKLHLGRATRIWRVGYGRP